MFVKLEYSVKCKHVDPDYDTDFWQLLHNGSEHLVLDGDAKPSYNAKICFTLNRAV